MNMFEIFYMIPILSDNRYVYYSNYFSSSNF